MFLNDFSTVIPQGTEQNGYVILPHGTTYTLRLRNRRRVKCDACVEIDGKNIGTWRLHPGESLELERPAEDIGKFTFYRSGTGEAGQVGESSISRESKGLVKVSFLPAKLVAYKVGGTLSMGEQIRGVSGQTTQYCSDSIKMCAGGASPASQSHMSFMETSTLDSMAASPSSPPVGAQAGVTGLTGASDQQFNTVGSLSNPDYSQLTVIQLRLVEGKAEPRELKPATNASAYPVPVD